MIDFYASQRQYVDHLWPIWQATAMHEPGAFYAAANRGGWDRASELGAPDATRVQRQPPAGDSPVVVASWSDALACHGRPVAMVEHGAGQSYLNADGTRSNTALDVGDRRRMVSLFLTPNQLVTDRQLEVVPTAEAAVVGCPRLDRWHRRLPCFCAGPGGAVGGHPDDGLMTVAAPWETADACDYHGCGQELEPWPRPVVAVSWHWENDAWPESRSALAEYGPAVVRLAQHVASIGGTMIGHAHPRARASGMVRRVYAKAGVHQVEHFDDVLDRADVYVCDNSSTIFEFASTHRPVVLLNASWYRRSVEHGLRFWEHADVGMQVDRPAELIDVVMMALADPDQVAERRRAAVAAVYGECDGRASQRAALRLAEWATSATCTEPPARHDPFRARSRRPR